MKSFLRSLFGATPKATARRAAPRLEAFEDRMVPTVSVTSLAGGELKITGIGYANDVRITQDDSDGVNSFKIVGDGQTWTYSSSSVKKVTVDLGVSNDYFTWSLLGSSKYAKEADISLGSGDDDANFFLDHVTIRADFLMNIDLGGNADYVSATLGHVSNAYVSLNAEMGSGDDYGWMNLQGDIYGTGTVNFGMDGGTGKDTMKMKVGSPYFGDGKSEIGKDANLFLRQYGGAEADTSEVTVDAELDGDLYMWAYGMDGNDTMGARINLKSGSTGRVDGFLNGGADNDIIGAQVTKEGTTIPSISLTADGVTGNDYWDSGYNGSNVVKKNFDGSTIVWDF